MPLALVQLMQSPGGPGITGAVKTGTGLNSTTDGTLNLSPATTTVLGGVKAGTGLSLAGDGTISVGPPAGGAIGGVKAGTNITIAPDGTISASGGAPGNFLPLTGGTLTGRLQIPVGSLSSASLGFTGSNAGTGLYSPQADYIGMTVGAGNTGFWMNNLGQIMAGRPEAINPSYNIGSTTYQAWSDSQTAPGQQNPGSSMFYMGNDNQFAGRVRFCRGEGSISNIEDIELGDEIGDILWCEAYANEPTGIPRAAITCNQAQNANEATRLYFWNTLDTQSTIARRWFIGGNGNFVPEVTASDDVGNPTNKVLNIWLQNAPIVGQPAYDTQADLAETFGLDYVNALQPISFVPEVEYNEVDGSWLVEPGPNNWNGIPGPSVVTPVAGNTIHWGFRATDVLALNQSLGLLGNMGVAGVVDNPAPTPDEPWIRQEELIPPLVLAVQQLSQQLTDLQTAFDDYVAAHP